MGIGKLIFTFWYLNRNSKKTREEILKVREKRFRRLLIYAFNRSKFYRDYYLSHGITEKQLLDIPIYELPPIDREIFVKNFDDIVTDNKLKLEEIQNFLSNNKALGKKYLNKYSFVRSSGSTGKPAYYVYDKKAWNCIISGAIRACKGENSIVNIQKLRKKQFKIAFLEGALGRFGGVMAEASGIESLKFSSMLLNINIPLEQWAEKLNSFKPNLLVGYPSIIKMVCDLINEDKVKINVQRVITCGEPLTKQMRNYLELQLKTEVFDIYGASESLILGAGRRKYDGIYLFDDLNYVEINDGCTYITPLYNYSQPLIRYKLSDRFKINECTEKEYLPFTKIESILGRNEELMWFENENGKGEFLHPLVIDEIDVEGLDNFQFIQYSTKSFEIHIEIRNGYDFHLIERAIRKQIDSLISEKQLNSVTYEIKRVSCIPINQITGKKQIVVKQFNSSRNNNQI